MKEKKSKNDSCNFLLFSYGLEYWNPVGIESWYSFHSYMSVMHNDIQFTGHAYTYLSYSKLNILQTFHICYLLQISFMPALQICCPPAGSLYSTPCCWDWLKELARQCSLLPFSQSCRVSSQNMLQQSWWGKAVYTHIQIYTYFTVQ